MCQRLGWEEIDVRFYGSLSAEERYEIELEENLRCKDLTSYERSKTMMRLPEAAAEALREEAKLTHDGSNAIAEKPPMPKGSGGDPHELTEAFAPSAATPASYSESLPRAHFDGLAHAVARAACP